MGALLSGFRRPGAWGCFLTALGMFLAVALLVTGTPAPAAASDALPAAEDAESLTAPDGVTAMAIARLANAPVDPQAAGLSGVGTGRFRARGQRSPRRSASSRPAPPVQDRLGGQDQLVSAWKDDA